MELQQRLQQEADLQLSIGRLWQLLRQLGLRLKKVTPRPGRDTEANRQRRAEFIETIRTNPAGTLDLSG